MGKHEFQMILAVALVVIGVQTSCRTKYVPVETVKIEHHHSTDTVHISDTVRDIQTSIIQEVDSSYLKGIGIINPPKKAYLVQSNTNKQEKHSLFEHKTDTVFQSKEIQVPYPVERDLSFWEKTWIKAGKIQATFFAILIISVIVRIYKRFRARNQIG